MHKLNHKMQTQTLIQTLTQAQEANIQVKCCNVTCVRLLLRRRLCRPENCKDANEVLLKEGAEALRKAVDGAIPYPIRGLLPLGKQ